MKMKVQYLIIMIQWCSFISHSTSSMNPCYVCYPGKLQEEGLQVWYKGMFSGAGSGDVAKAILKCKVFLQVLSENSASSKVCLDELSLAYISNKEIFPVGLKKFSVVASHLDSGRKLMLAKINWTFFVKEEDWEINMPEMISRIKQEVTAVEGEKIADTMDFDEVNFTMNKTHQMYEGDVPADVQDMMKDLWKPGEKKAALDFWDRHFEGKDSVSWIDFKGKFLEEYSDQLKKAFGDDRPWWVTNLMFKDIFEQSAKIDREKYNHFCGRSLNPDVFFKRLEEYSVCIQAMKEVFSMDSSVRLAAVQNMASFKTPAVLSILLDQLSDSDPNMRAVAALALGKSNQINKKTISKLKLAVEDEDRLVRESVCLALGHLKVSEALDPLLDRWRNDPISTVREAAKLALEKIPGPEAKSAIKVTQVLTDEMTNLRKLRKK